MRQNSSTGLLRTVFSAFMCSLDLSSAAAEEADVLDPESWPRVYRGGEAEVAIYGPRGVVTARAAYNPWTNTAVGCVTENTPYGSWGRTAVVHHNGWVSADPHGNARGTVTGVQTPRSGAAVGMNCKFGSNATGQPTTQPASGRHNRGNYQIHQFPPAQLNRDAYSRSQTSTCHVRLPAFRARTVDSAKGAGSKRNR